MGFSFPEHRDGSAPRLLLQRPPWSFAKKSRGSFFRHVPPLTGGHKTVVVASQDRSPPPGHPPQQQGPQGFTASTYFSLNTNLPRQWGVEFFPPKIKAIQHNSNFFEDRNISPPLPPTLPRGLCVQRYSQFVGPVCWHLLRREASKHRLHSLSSWKPCTADNLNKLLPSTTITDTLAATCTSETEDPHLS